MDTRIDFCGGLNIIGGPSGSGKSAIIRNIELILFNKIEDTNFITHGLDAYEGEMGFVSGKRVVRILSKKENLYKLYQTSDDIDPLVLTSFGSGPVKEVLDFHGVKPIRIGKKDKFISVHSQHDQPFFLTDSPSDKAQVIGCIAKTDIVDMAIADISTDIRRGQLQYTATEKAIKVQDEKIESFSVIEQMKEDDTVIGAMMSQINALSDNISAVYTSNAVLSQKIPQYESLNKTLSKKERLDKAMLILDYVYVVKTTADTLRQNIDGLSENNVKLLNCQKTINIASQEDIIQALKTIDFLLSRQDTLVRVNTSLQLLNEYSDKLSKQQKILKTADQVSGVGEMIADVNAKRENLKQWITSAANLDSEVDRLTKSNFIIKLKKEAVSAAEKEITDEISKNPVCPICGSNLQERTEAVLSA